MDASGSINKGKKKVRGPYCGANIVKEIKKLRKDGITHLQVEFNALNGEPVGKTGKWFNNSIASLVRDTLSPTYTHWKDVPRTEIQTIYERLSEKFRFPMDNKVIRDLMEKKMEKAMIEWRCAMRKHWVTVGGEVAKTRPYRNVSPSSWTKLCDHFASDSQRIISQRNKANRAKMTMLGGHGSKSIIAHIHDKVDELGHEQSMIDTFEEIHHKKNGWLSVEGQKAHLEMTQKRESRSRDTTNSLGASCVDNDDAQLPPDSDIVGDVLGHRSRYKRGLGSLPRLKVFGGQRAYDLASNFTSQVELEKLQEENRQIKQNFVAQHECAKPQLRFTYRRRNK